MELWGGVECTINRVGNVWSSQLTLSAHEARASDLELIAGLGIRTLRYPILWEMIAPGAIANARWRWADERLGQLHRLGITPIVGLVHHGSGPSWTHLLDQNFAEGLAQYAAAVAERFPWIEWYTPVNEPLTTARFSGLYGHWYPHGRSNRAFARSFINQCRAIVLAMQAIRRRNPRAQLIQTEDLGTTYSTPRMSYQRDFDNERRWLTWDLLTGRIGRTHPLRAFLCDSGIDSGELDWFADNPCPPHIIGINHYVTSDRFLDERANAYPAAARGSNSHEPYADVEAVRALSQPYRGWSVLESSWERYRLPVALTEVHLGCTREEQLRWLRDAWAAAGDACARGCDVRAVTAWALFGSFNWDTLLTRTDGSYEPGAFDVRAGYPRPTALAHALQELALGGASLHPSAYYSGWWRRSTAAPPSFVASRRNAARKARRGPPLFICGAGGSLGQALLKACEVRNLQAYSTTRATLDICNPAAIERLLDEVQPWAIVNAAGFVKVDEAEAKSAECFAANSTGPLLLMQASGRRDIPVLTFSSDLVFDGLSTVPYVESSRTAPTCIYGRSKKALEFQALRYERSLCVRTAAFFGAWDHGDFLIGALQALRSGRAVHALSDVIISPTYLPDLADASLDLLIDGAAGIYHLANRGAVSWSDLATLGAQALEIRSGEVRPIPQRDFGLPAERPAYSVLGSERIGVMPTLGRALERFAQTACSTALVGLVPRHLGARTYVNAAQDCVIRPIHPRSIRQQDKGA